jgi:hypothetical protein
MESLVSNIQAIVTAPLTEKLDITHLFLLVGLVLVMIAAWMIILGYIRSASIEVLDAT